jgi:hypothetical protein
VLVVVTGALLIVACGDGDTDSGPKFGFTDAKGRVCTQQRFGLVATCNATPAPRNACPAGMHPCFVVFAGAIQAAGTDGGIGPPPLWNCDACCAATGSVWQGVGDDCSSYRCTSPADCSAEDGTCDNGQCHAGQ